jgi:hypothetical protein
MDVHPPKYSKIGFDTSPYYLQSKCVPTHNLPTQPTNRRGFSARLANGDPEAQDQAQLRISIVGFVDGFLGAAADPHRVGVKGDVSR